MSIYTLYSIVNPLFIDENDVDSNNYGLDHDSVSDGDEDD